MVEFCNNEKKELISLSNLDKESIDKLNALESTLSKSLFITGEMITPSDITTLDDIETMYLDIPNSTYPKILKWMKEINRLKLNWKLSKRPDKGRTFNEYIQKSQKKINEQKIKYEHELVNKNNASKDLLHKHYQEKEIAVIHFNPKTDSGYEIMIKVKFLPIKEGQQDYTLTEISSKLAIVTHSYLKNKTEIQSNKNDKGELTAEITSIISTEDYDIEPLAIDLKRNVNGVFNVEINSIKKI